MKKLILIVCACAMLFACKTEKPNVNLTTPKTAFSILTIIADQQGYFELEGLQVNINYVKTGKIALDDLLAGNADVANIVETNVAFAGFSNPNIQVFCNIEEVYDAGIVARKDKGILHPTDLKGKKLGVLLATTSQVFAHRFLEKHGIPKDSVQFVNLLPPAMQSAILEGSGVDAISIWQPYVYNAEQALGDDNSVTFNDTEIFTGYMTLAGKSDFAAENPETIKAMLKAYLAAEKFAMENPEEAKTIISEFLNLPMETLENIWSQYTLRISLEQSLIEDTRREGEWITQTIEEYGGRTLPDYTNYFNPIYLEAVAPEKVQVAQKIED